MARPFIDIDFEKLDLLLSLKITKKTCALYLNCCEYTLEKKVLEKYGMPFPDYAELKLTDTKFKLATKAIDMALSGNTTMMIFCLKNINNWNDNNRPDNDVGQIQIQYKVIEKPQKKKDE